MPYYNYTCPLCDITWERKATFNEDVAALCPQCSKKLRPDLYPLAFKLAWFTPEHNKDPFNPHPEGYKPENVRYPDAVYH